MKLLECHIAGFGVFSDYRMTFEDGLNVIMQPNGWGKTTLAAFIKAMFYGFDRRRVHDVTENERLRYRPWGGGRYGGTLDFENEGVSYRISRSFGERPVDDTCKVINLDTGEPVAEAQECVGEWLFGLDANAFRKSVFVEQEGFGLEDSAEGLRKRLNSLVNEADDVAGLDKVLARLDDRRKFYKKTGNRGRLSDLSRAVEKLVAKRREKEGEVGQLEDLSRHLRDADVSLMVLEERLKDAQANADRAKEAQSELQALAEVRKQLAARGQEAAEALGEFDAAGEVPGGAALDTMRKALETLGRLEGEEARARRSLEKIQAQRDDLMNRRGGCAVTKAAVDEHRALQGEMLRQSELAQDSDAEAAQSYRNADRAVAANPDLPEKIDALVAAWPSVEGSIDEQRRESDALAAEDAQWRVVRARLESLRDDARAAADAVPADAGETIERLREAATALRQCGQERMRLEAQEGAARDRLAALERELGPWADGEPVQDEVFEAIQAGADAYAAAARDVATAATALRAEESKLDEVREGLAERSAELQRAQEKLSAARSERDGALADGSLGKKPLGGVVMLVLAAVCIIGGIVCAMAGEALLVVAVAAIVVGAVLAVAGFSSLRKGARSAQEARESKLNECDKRIQIAEESYKDARHRFDEAQSALEAQQQVVADAGGKVETQGRSEQEEAQALAGLLGEHVTVEASDGAAVLAEVPAVLRGLSDRNKGIKQVRALRDDLAQKQEALSEVARTAQEHLSSAGVDGSGDHASDADALGAEATRVEALVTRAEQAEQRLTQELAGALAPYGSGDAGGAEELLAQECAPGCDDRRERVATLRAQQEAYVETLSKALRLFGLEETAEPSLAVERLARALEDYRLQKQKDEQASAERGRARQEAESLAQRLDHWAQELGLQGHADLTVECFDALAEDAAELERLEWELQGAAEQVESAAKTCSSIREKALPVFARYGIEGEGAQEAFDNLTARSRRRDELVQAAALAEAQLAEWDEKNGGALREAQERAASADADGPAGVEELKRQRDLLLNERAQIEERRKACLGSLEDYLEVGQELGLLSQEKQVATANLFTVQETAKYLTAARKNLDERYLGDLTDRFNDYVGGWLADEGIDGSLDHDLNIKVSQGSGEVHDAEAYSTGYRDMLDICLRTALIDTIFEDAQPFVVMDDPFVNLDEEKVRRALMLLEALSKGEQIIYFTCHPSRMEVDGEQANAQFTIPAQRAPRESTRARLRREENERALAQLELVSSYHLGAPTQGRASIRTVDGPGVITTNMFSIRFGLDPDAGRRDNSFDVHFIDEKGRALCERQTVEVVDGQVVPERVRFCLTTYADGGSSYDLIVHEDGKDPAELVARTPYKADIAFNTEDFGF